MAEAPSLRVDRPITHEAARIAPGLYAWVATVLSPVLERGSSAASRVAAAFAVLALVAPPWIGARRPRLSRALAIHGFAIGSVACWAFLGDRLAVERLDPVRSALGGLGFLLHALAWGTPAPASDRASRVEPGPPLTARHRPPLGAPIVLVVGVVAALAPAVAAYGVNARGPALLAHSIAVMAGVLGVAVAADIALRVGKTSRPRSPSARLSGVAWPLGALTVLLAAGLMWSVLR